MINGQNFALIGFAEALAAPEVAWSLVDAGFRVTAFARKGRHSALRHSRKISTCEITAPESSCDAAVSDLERLVSQEKGSALSVLFPLDDAAAWLCSR